ncbi:MAG: S8 family serine peptidase [Halolamina sp.]
MRTETATVLLVVVLAVSSVAMAAPVGSSSAFDAGDQPVGMLSSATGPADPPTAQHDPPSTSQETLAGFAEVHEAGVTGDDVRVGVLGSQFAPAGSPIDDEVVGSRQFGGDERELFADTTHDTAVAEIVTRTAPDADLYLASVGTDGSPERYERAVEWLRAKDVDVVVDSGSYFPTSPAGMAKLNEVAAETAENDTAFVTSAGNYADSHWAGMGESGWVSFENDTRYNTLGDGEISGTTSLRLYWTGDADYDLYLYRAESGEDTLVAKSTGEDAGNGSHSEAIDARLPGGEYYVAVRGGPNASGTDVELFASNHELAISSENGGMVAPATAEGVIAVGAVDGVSGEPRPYSSTGPELDISAPDGAATSSAGDLYGSSAAAPLAAGTLALMLGENDRLSATGAEYVLRDSAVRDDGRLYLDAAGAVQAASPESEPGFSATTLAWYNETASEDGS